jgi:paraquat-inducible protein A
MIHQLPLLQEGQSASCTRCLSTIAIAGEPSSRSANRTAAAAVAAFILFWPAILLPILEVERLGQHSQQSLLSGIVDLLRHGNYFVGIIVLLFSIVFPLSKLLLLIELSWIEILHRRHRAISLRLMEHFGKWSMMDVMLLAFLVMLVKLGSLVSFHLGPAVIAFVLCVTMSMIASLSFDPHSIWDSVGDE